jgi:UDP-N-acetylmuramoylalanine--D-glutamate ligase
MEFVAEVNGIAYINDARSVTPLSTRAALQAIETSVVLIMGGNDSGSDYSVLASALDKVVGIVYLGNNAEKIFRLIHSRNMLFVKAEDLKEAVVAASCYACSGDAVLYSPASEGFSSADTYKIKGSEFRSLVTILKS